MANRIRKTILNFYVTDEEKEFINEKTAAFTACYPCR